MHNIWRAQRWLAHKLSVALLANAVAFGIPLLAFGIHITDPQIMKDWLSSTDTYETLINESLNLIELEATNAESEGSLGDSLAQNPFVDAATVTQALRETLSPEFIQAEAEDFIDGAYEWLDTRSEVPNFEFSLAEKNDELSEALGESLKQQFENMPECTPEEFTPTFNLLETLCQPPGIDLSREVDALVAELAGEEGLLSNATWDGDDLIRMEGEESGLSETQVDFAQGAYDGLKNGPMYLIFAGIFAIPVIFYSSRSQYRGYNEIANTLFSGAMFTFIPAIIIARWENIITSLIGSRNDVSTSSVDAVRALFEPFLEAAVNDIASLTAWISGFVLIIGGLMVAYGFYLRKIYQEQEDDDLAEEIAAAKERRRIQEVRQHAKKRARHTDKTLDPETNKPLENTPATLSKEEAARIARDPKYWNRPLTELKPKTHQEDDNQRK